jgi:hypothetical protein
VVLGFFLFRATDEERRFGTRVRVIPNARSDKYISCRWPLFVVSRGVWIAAPAQGGGGDAVSKERFFNIFGS